MIERLYVNGYGKIKKHVGNRLHPWSLKVCPWKRWLEDHSPFWEDNCSGAMDNSGVSFIISSFCTDYNDVCIYRYLVFTLAYLCGLPPKALYNPYVLGTWWYKFRVLSQKCPHFPFDICRSFVSRFNSSFPTFFTTAAGVGGDFINSSRVARNGLWQKTLPKLSLWLVMEQKLITTQYYFQQIISSAAGQKTTKKNISTFWKKSR